MRAFFFFQVIRIQELTRRGIGSVFQDMTGILLGQNLPHQLPNSSASRVLIAAWLAFALIFGTAYRGNLTAYLTLPKYPSRPETLPQLVEVVKRCVRACVRAECIAQLYIPSVTFFTKLDCTAQCILVLGSSECRQLLVSTIECRTII